jgi:hypothetical protein
VRGVALLVLPLLAACAAGDAAGPDTSAPFDTGDAAALRCGAVLRDEVAEVTGELWYTSETDALVEPVWLPVPGGAAVPLDPAVVRDAAGIDASKAPDVRELDAWFSHLVEGWEGMDPAQAADADRWAALRDWLRANTRGPAVFRFGEIEIPVLGVGVDPCGDLVGFRTLAVET